MLQAANHAAKMNSVKNNGGCDRMNSLFKEMLNFSL